VEVEASYHSPYIGDNESDVILATFEPSISAQVNDWVAAGASLLYEEDATDLEVDTGFITIGNGDVSPLFLTAGQIYIPFGAFESNMVSDPLTLEIGETRESALQLGFEQQGLGGSVYVFNGTNKKDGKNQIGTWGANLGYAQETSTLSWAAGLGYISDLGDSETLQEIIMDTTGSNTISDRTGGWTLNANAQLGAFNLIGEYLAATERFANGTVPWKLTGAKPAAWIIEFGYNFDLVGKEATMALGYQSTEEALALGLPKDRWMLGLSLDVMDRTALAFEWAHDEDYERSEGGTGKSADTVTAQVAVEF
jgi:hypothetical protein